MYILHCDNLEKVVTGFMKRKMYNLLHGADLQEKDGIVYLPLYMTELL